jgi:hypothetical protein
MDRPSVEYDAALNADLDDHGGALHRAFAGAVRPNESW